MKQSIVLQAPPKALQRQQVNQIQNVQKRFETTTTTTKVNQVGNKMKEGILEGKLKIVYTQVYCVYSMIMTVTEAELLCKFNVIVREIFQKVDNTFKRRKEDNDLLDRLVRDSENHLSYLENQTEQQVEATAQLSLALAVAQSNLIKVEQEVKDFNAQQVEPVKETLEDLTNTFRTGKYKSNCEIIKIVFIE